MHSVGESLLFIGEAWGLPVAEDVRRRRRKANRKRIYESSPVEMLREGDRHREGKESRERRGEGRGVEKKGVEGRRDGYGE